VLTNQPLNDIFDNQDSSGRIGKWTMELSEHVIDFEKRNAIKSQVLADFIADWMEPSSYTKGPVTDTSWQVVLKPRAIPEQGLQQSSSHPLVLSCSMQHAYCLIKKKTSALTTLLSTMQCY
jgi:hypothetical protein